MFAARTNDDPSMTDRLALLGARPLLHGLGDDVLKDIDANLASLQWPGGAKVVERGQTGVPFMLVVEGGLRASFEDDAGLRHVVLECFRGGTMGEALVMSGQPSALDVEAIRDTRLLCLSPEKFHAIALRHPALTLRFARSVTARFVALTSSPESLAFFSQKLDRLPRSIAILSVSERPAARQTRDLLIDALTRSRTTIRLGAREARAVVSDPLRGGLGEWIAAREPSPELVVFECDPSDTSWIDFCLRQADRVMVLLEDDRRLYDGAREQALAAATTLAERGGNLEVALVHAPGAELPSPGAGNHGIAQARRLHHVRGGHRLDAERLARWLMDRPVGLVLSGGGAYGLAHVGVIRALEEARVPIDIVAGTSMGSIFAGAVALGWSADRMKTEVEKLFSSRFALYDPTLPFTSLLAGEKLDRVLDGYFGDVLIEDCWRPFFCISTDLSHARPEVHASGQLRDASRCSWSIPGLFPPHRAGDRLLVDGGLVDNLPIDVMGDRCRGAMIAVNVFPYGARAKRARPRHHRLHGLAAWIKTAAHLVGPSVFEILTRATLLGSQRTTEMSLVRHPPGLYLEPAVDPFHVLEWDAYDALDRAGYESASEALSHGALPRSLWEGHIERDASV
jgi:predicted acylesterase/phospholipase RssA/CRP-like cAMP-binding protein